MVYLYGLSALVPSDQAFPVVAPACSWEGVISTLAGSWSWVTRRIAEVVPAQGQSGGHSLPKEPAHTLQSQQVEGSETTSLQHGSRYTGKTS